MHLQLRKLSTFFNKNPQIQMIPKQAVVHLTLPAFNFRELIKGLVDLAKCKERLLKKKDDCEGKLESLIKEMNRPNYEEKAPEDVRNKNAERKQTLLAEIEQSNDAFLQIQAMEV